jgi:hypothetical protein
MHCDNSRYGWEALLNEQLKGFWRFLDTCKGYWIHGNEVFRSMQSIINTSLGRS